MFTQAEYDRGDAVAFSWHKDDFKKIDPDLKDEQARQVLANFEKHHEGSQEAMWLDLEYHVDELNREG